MTNLDRFRPEGRGATALFVDTSALFALCYDHAPRNPEAEQFFDAVKSGVLPYRPLYVNQHVLGETVTLLVSRVSTDAALQAIDTLSTTSAIETIPVEDAEINATIAELRQYRDARIAFADHTIGVQAQKRSVDHVFTYDGDFETLGLTTIPHWSS